MNVTIRCTNKMCKNYGSEWIYAHTDADAKPIVPVSVARCPICEVVGTIITDGVVVAG